MEKPMATVKIFDKKYPNLFAKVSLTSEEIEKQVKTIKYANYTDRSAEGRSPYPFVYAFYHIIKRFKNIPYQEAFWRGYLFDLKRNGINIDDKSEAYQKGLKARVVSRAFPSLIREFHFATLIKECLDPQRYTVFYNEDLDLEKGIDILVYNTESNQFLAICILQKTKISEKELKRKRKKRDRRIQYLEFQKDINKSTKGIQLYCKEDALKLIDDIDEFFGLKEDIK